MSDVVAPSKRFSRFQIAVALLIVLALTEIIVIAALLLKSYTSPPPLAYDKVQYEAEQPVLCPGDRIAFTATLTVQQAGRIDIVRQFWDVTTGKIAMLRNGKVSSIISDVRVLPPSTVGQARATRNTDVTIPDLGPGAYWLLNTTSAPMAGQGVYFVPFIVRAGCPPAPTPTPGR